MVKENLPWRSFAVDRATCAKWSAGTPAYYLIDSRGVIRNKWVGNPGNKALDRAIEDLLQAPQAGAKDAAKQ